MSKNNLNSKKSKKHNTKNNQKDKPPSFTSTIEQQIAVKSKIGIPENDKK